MTKLKDLTSKIYAQLSAQASLYYRERRTYLDSSMSFTTLLNEVAQLNQDVSSLRILIEDQQRMIQNLTKLTYPLIMPSEQISLGLTSGDYSERVKFEEFATILSEIKGNLNGK